MQMSEEKKTVKWYDSLLAEKERMVLKNAAGTMLDEAPAVAQAAYYRVCNKEGAPSKHEHEICFACLCMDCMWETFAKRMPYQELLSGIYHDKKENTNIKERCIEILDEPWRKDGYLLYKIFSLAMKMRKKNPGVKPDFYRLADDLYRWNSDKRYVQRKWIETICK